MNLDEAERMNQSYNSNYRRNYNNKTYEEAAMRPRITNNKPQNYKNNYSNNNNEFAKSEQNAPRYNNNAFNRDYATAQQYVAQDNNQERFGGQPNIQYAKHQYPHNNAYNRNNFKDPNSGRTTNRVSFNPGANPGDRYENNYNGYNRNSQPQEVEDYDRIRNKVYTTKNY